MALTINQWRDSGILPQIKTLEAWHQYEAGVSANNLINDYTDDNRHLVCAALGAPVLTANVYKNFHGWYFDGTSNPLAWTGAVTIKHVFVFASFQETAFTASRGLLTGVSGAYILTSEATGTKFTVHAPGTTPALYRKSGVLYASGNMQAPMAGKFALLEATTDAANTIFNGIQVGQNGAFAAQKHKGHFVEQLIFSVELTDLEVQRVRLYFALKYSLWNNTTESLPLYFPSSDIVDIRRKRFAVDRPEWQKVTDSHEYEDGGRTFNEVSSSAPQRWEYDYLLINKNASTDPPEQAIFDAFNDEVRRANPFTFRDKWGVEHTNVRIENYDNNHRGHMPWKKDIKFRLVKYPN